MNDESVKVPARRINEIAAGWANEKANDFFAELPKEDVRSGNINIFDIKRDWNQHGPFGLVMVETNNLTKEDKEQMRHIAKLAIRQALADNPDILAELITSYAAIGENFYEAFRR